MDASIQSDTANLDKMKTKAGELSEKISSTKNGVFGMGEATKKPTNTCPASLTE